MEKFFHRAGWLSIGFTVIVFAVMVFTEKVLHRPSELFPVLVVGMLLMMFFGSQWEMYKNRRRP